MVLETDLYDILEVSPTCTEAELKKAYHRLARVHHPDRGGDHSQFQAIQGAYETLSHQESRAEYDRFGSGKNRPPPHDFDQNGAYDDGMEDIFASMFGGGRREPEPVRPSVVKLDLTLEELFGGGDKKIEVSRERKCHGCRGTGGKKGARRRECSRCHGRGITVGMRRMGSFMTTAPIECSTCKGSGSVLRAQDLCKKCNGRRTLLEKKRLTFLLERGLQPGERLVLAGEGDERADSPPVDLHLVLTLLPHPTFTYHSPANLSTSLSVTLSESLLGFSRTIINHLDGRGLTASHPSPGEKGWRVLQTGDELVVRGQGMWDKRGGRGDLRLFVEVEMPGQEWAAGISAEQVEVLSKLLPPRRDSIPLRTGSKSEPVTLEAASRRSSQKRRPDDDEEEQGPSRPGCTQQ